MIRIALLLAASAALAAIQTGPAVGERIPAFELEDHRGARRSFSDLRGPEGLVLVFMRSADW